MQVSFRTALLVCAAMSASSVAPAQVGPKVEPLLPVASVITPSTLAHELLKVSDQVTAPALEAEAQAEEEAVAEAIEEVADPKADLQTLVADLRSSDPGDRQLECLAVGIYFESKGEPLSGQLAVGEVIVNRAKSKKFPSSYCGVLLQPRQFSFVRGKSWPKVARGSQSWKTAVAIAKIVDKDLKNSSADDALFFHARRVKPRWKLTRVASIGNHIFYR